MLLLVAMLGAGLLLQRLKLGERLLPWLNHWILKLAIPALTLVYLTRLHLSWRLLLPIACAWLIFLVCWGLLKTLGPRLGFDRATVGCLMLVAGLGNTSFVGFPLIRLFYGDSGLQTAVLVDQPGSFLILGTLGLLVAAAHAGEQVEARQLLQRVFGFPPFLAFLLALAAQLLRWQPSGLLAAGLEALGATLSPLALLAVGLQLRFDAAPELKRPLLVGLSLKLLLAPLLIAGLYAGLLGLRGETMEICVLEAGMGPMITAAIVACNFGLAPRLASRMLAIGIPLSLLSVPAWYWLLRAACL